VTRPSLPIRVWLLCFALTSLAGESAAIAAEEKVVSVVASGDPSAIASVEVVVRELVARLAVALEWSQTSAIDAGQVLAPPAPDDRVVARAWMDMSNPKRARIYVANASSRRFLVRIVPLHDGYDEIGREVLGHIIESAVDAFLAGRDVGVAREIAEREVTEESEPTPHAPIAPATPVAKAVSSEFAVSYQVTEVARATTMHGPALGIGLAFPIGKAERFSSSATVHYRLPLAWDSQSIGARFDGGTVRLSAGIEGDAARWLVLCGQLGFGVDVAHVAPYLEAGSTTTAAAPFWVVSPIATATASLEAALSRRIGLLVGIGCDVDLSGSSYFVANGMKATTVLLPWVAHPTGALGLLFRLDEPRVNTGE
jgi:hypothetical protein